ncbi:alpha/beta hydrolase-fold protein [Nocardia sp. NPDC020380]|uniref:alpha/beta hydrolase-fold protein n=1 Tax=Nocardia sp. NPDC020380 TaxID=3364309 RepID=UPI0037994101
MPAQTQVGYPGFHHGISLLHGWLPQVITFVAVFLLIVAFARFTRRWWLLWVPICLVIAVGIAWASWIYTNNQGLASDPAPVLLWITIGMAGAALAAAVLGIRTGRWWQRTAAILAVPVALLNVGVVLNQWVGYYPTANAAWDALTAEPLPHQTSLASLTSLRNTNVDTGKIVPVDIPESGSHFNHRTEYVYLPPAWFQGPKPPTLPVIMMIGGEFNTPADWVRSGQIMPTVDNFAKSNNGQAPIMVFVDSGGSFNNDTECVNGPRGDAADHLTKDVPSYVESTFGASSDPAKWGIVGWSMGGTCAVDLAVMHPDLFGTFVDIAGDLGPDAGNKQQTITRLFGGSEATWAAYDPTTVMQKHGPYTDTVGLFDDLTPPAWQKKMISDPNVKKMLQQAQPSESTVGMGGRDAFGETGEVGAAESLCAEGQRVNINCTVHTTEGGHTWQFAAAAFTSSLPWMTARLGIPVQGMSS